MATQTLTQARLKELLDYNQETGVFTWLVRTSRRINVGDISGCPDANGYLLIGIDRHLYKAHRLAFLWVEGVWPQSHVDHRNGIPQDNRFCNLRKATNSENMQNERHARKNNKCGLLGVSPNNQGFLAQIVIPGKTLYLGTFKTPELAHAAYLKAKHEHHPFATI
jgi:hypothetical protein